MLDHSIVLAPSDVSDGNTHSHQDMPFIVAGGALSGGRALDAWGRRHGELLASLCHALGETVDGYSDAASGPLPGLLS